jgi:DNA-binding beta-propeller fold protein YncE
MKPIGIIALFALSGCGGVTFPPDGGRWPAAPVPDWAHQPRLGMTDNGDDTLAFVSTDLPTPKRLALVPIGDVPVELEGPHHIAASPDGGFLYVNLSNYVPGSGSGPHGSHGLGTVPGSLVKLRAGDLVSVGETAVDRSPGDLILSKDGKTAFVSHYDLLRFMNQQSKGLPEADGYSTVAIVDTVSMSKPPLYPVCATGHGMALSADEKTAYVTCTQVDQLALLDLTTHQATRVPVGPSVWAGGPPMYGPYAITRSPADGTLWLSCNNSGELRAFDPRTGKMDPTSTLFVGGVPMFSAFMKDGTTLVLPHQGDDKVSIVDTSVRPPVEKALITLPEMTCLKAHVATVSADDETAWVVCEGDHDKRPGTVVAINLVSKTVQGYVEVGIYPDGIVQLPPAP